MEAFLKWILISILTTGLGLWIYSKKYTHLPGNLGRPVFGNLYRVIYSLVKSSEINLVKRAAETLDEYGDVSCMWQGPCIVVLVADPYVIEEIATHPACKDKETMAFDNLHCIAVGAFSTGKTDSEWKMHRKRMLHSLSKFQLENYQNIFNRRSVELVESIKTQNGCFDLSPLISLSVMDMFMETHFGVALSGLVERNFQFYEDFKRLAGFSGELVSNPLSLLFGDPWARYQLRKAKHFNITLKKVIEEIKRRTDKHNENNNEDAKKIAAAEDILFTNTMKGVPESVTHKELTELMFAGGHTTSEFLTAMVLFIAIHPDVQDKLWQEQKEIFKGSKRQATSEDIKRMKYLEMVFKEAARIVSGPILARRFKEDAKIRGYLIPKNSTILICSFRVKMHPKYWENPTMFYPERFLHENMSGKPKLVNPSFGMKPRNCPGNQYAENCSKVVVSTLLRHFKISSPLKYEEVKFHPVLLMELQGPCTISCEPRS